MSEKWSDIPKTNAAPIDAYEKREARGWWMVGATMVAGLILMVVIYLMEKGGQ